jgi:hypothetical protein
MGLKLQIDTNKLKGLVENKMKKAIQTSGRTAVNKAMTATRKLAIDQVNKDTGLAKNLVGSKMQTYKARLDFLSAKIRISKAGIALDQFKPQKTGVQSARGPRVGVTVKIGKSPRVLVPGGFLATTKRGKTMILKRKGQARYPTERPYLVDNPIVKALVDGKHMGELEKKAYDTFETVFASEFKKKTD